MIKKYVAKRIEIEAYQITRELICSVLFDGAEYPDGLVLRKASANPTCRCVMEWLGEITRPDGSKQAVVEGMFVIKSGSGWERMTWEEFSKTYELVD